MGQSDGPPVEKEPSPRPQKRAPRAVKAPELAALLQGDTAVKSGEEWLRPLGPLATERVLPETWAQEQAEGVGRSRDERRGAAAGSRHGDEDGTLKTAEGVRRGKVPHVRGIDTPYRSQGWATLATTSDGLQTWLVAMGGGGLSQRDIEAALEQALGQGVRSQSALRPMPDTLSQAYAALRPRARRGYDGASLFIATVYAPWRRGGRKTGGMCVGGSGVDGRQGWLPRSTAPRESVERGREGRRALTMRGLQTPVPSTTEEAPGRINAVECVWPKSLRMRGWCHTMQHLMPQGPPQAWPALQALVVARRDAPTSEAGPRRLPHVIAP